MNVEYNNRVCVERSWKPTENELVVRVTQKRGPGGECRQTPQGGLGSVPSLAQDPEPLKAHITNSSTSWFTVLL